MQKNRLGCFTSTGIIAAFISLFVIVGVAFASGSQMFSPGDLNAEAGQSYGGVTSHAQITECKECHVAPWETATMADRCAACHTDIAAQMFDVAKLHGAIKEKNSAVACRDCHPEHRGATAALTDLGENTFPHEVLAFSLEGHQLTVTREAFTCKDCHHESITTFASDSCESCHRQIDIVFTQAHTLSFGKDCLACHDGVDTYGDDFTHSAFAFQLNGRHVDVASCTKCHLDARTVADLRSAPQDCFSCHQKDDEHTGRFGQDCSACHTPNDWEGAVFDHNKSNFPLTGKHSDLACESCHVAGQFSGISPSCASCHADPAFHAGMFSSNCAECHSTNNWSAVYRGPHPGIADEGGSGVNHGNTSCRTCHTSTLSSATCTACHEGNNFDDHNGGGDN